MLMLRRIADTRMDLWAMLAAAIVAALVLLAATQVEAQTLTVLHAFSGSDGQHPHTGLTMDRAGNLYGTTSTGGLYGEGAVFKLSRRGSAWTFQTLYSFRGGDNDGFDPEGRVTMAPDGSLYGTLSGGGPGCYPGQGCGLVYQLRPSAAFCGSVMCPWNETVLYMFTGSQQDGASPLGDLVLDQQGNIYGTSSAGVYELGRSSGRWELNLLCSTSVSVPYGVVFDGAGNLFGADYYDIFKLTNIHSGCVRQNVYTFNEQRDGYTPGGLILDHGGNVYGANFNGGSDGGGTVFQLAPANGSWSFSVLHAFTGQGFGGPYGGSLLMDVSGNLYGSTMVDGLYGGGSTFRLTPGAGSWTFTSLYDFHIVDESGSYPNNTLVMDSSGTIYGTTMSGGSGNPGNGVVFAITPN